MAKKLYFKIGEACKRVDIQPYVLRYWETEFPVLAPSKSRSGQRVYSEQDLKIIRRIKELLYDEGYTIAGAKKKLDGEDLSALSPLAPKAKAPKPAPKPEPAAKRVTGPAKEPEPAKKGASVAAAKPTPKRRAASKKAPKKAAAAKASEPSEPAPMSPTVRKGIQKALREARAILKQLDSGT